MSNKSWLLSDSHSALAALSQETASMTDALPSEEDAEGRLTGLGSFMRKCGQLPARRRILLSYLADILAIILCAVPAFSIRYLAPYNRKISLSDETIQYPHKLGEFVPNPLLVAIAVIIPLVVITVVLALRKFKSRRLLVTYIGLFLALAVTILFTNVIKNTVGRPRPDFLARCNADPDIVGQVVCRGPKELVLEGRRSFPSGHSSISFAGLGYLALFIAGQLHVYDSQGYVWKFLLALVPLMGALLVAVSRVADYRHHWQDVVFGGLLGLLFAYAAYRLYFPPLGSKHPHEPFEERSRRMTEPTAAGSSQNIV